MLILNISFMKKSLINKVLSKINPIIVIRKSKLFNAKWYTKTYNVKQINAAKHYFEIGYKEGKDPSKDFDNNLYIELYPSILGMNPLLHYELYGRDENRIYKDANIEKQKYDKELIKSHTNGNKSSIVYIDLFLNDDSKSGAIDFSKQKISELLVENNIILLEYKQFTNNWQITINNKYIDGFDINNLYKLIKDFKIKEIYINNLAYNSKIEDIINLLIRIKRNNSIKFIYHFHDYLSICPSSFLLDDENMPCEKYLLGKCQKCLLNNKNAIIRREDINRWRKDFENLFNEVDRFVFFSNYTKKIISSVFDITTKGEIIEHKTLLSEDSTKYIKSKKDEKIRIAFVGNFSYPKGSELFENTIKLLKNKNKIITYIIGYSSVRIPKNYIVTGKYERDNLGKILTENNIDLVIYPSIDNETYSYVVQELMQLKVPFTLFKCGAPAERVMSENYQFAEIANEINEHSMFEAVIRLLNKL